MVLRMVVVAFEKREEGEEEERGND